MTRRTSGSLTILIAVLATVLLATACSGDDAGDASASSSTPSTTAATAAPPPPEPAPGTSPPPVFEPTPITWEPCGGGMECGTLTVPRDPDDPAGPTVGLAVARRPATDPDQRIGVLLVNPGGPGASGVSFLRGGLGLPEVTERFDVVAWDPRGVGGSSPLACGSTDGAYLAADPTPDDAGEQAALEASARTVADECANLDGDLLAHVGTDTTVADLDLLRRALGEEQISYLGFSYGTFIGQLYAEAHPERVRAMALDAVVDPATDLAGLSRSQAVGVEAALERALAACTGSGCPVDDAAASFDAVRASVETDPLPAAGGAVGPAEVQLAGVLVTYDDGLWPDLWEALADAEAGDGSGLRVLADRYLDLVPYSPYVAVLCVDWPHPSGPEPWRDLADDLEAVAPRTGRAIGNELLPCAYWPADSWRDPQPVRAAGAAPILVIGATGDAATPYDSAVAVAEALDSGVLLTHEYNGHVSTTSSSCVAGWVTDHLVNLVVPPSSTTC